MAPATASQFQLSADDARRIATFIAEIARSETHGRKTTYVDYGDYRKALLTPINHLVYGRRGSGKTTLLDATLKAAVLKNILPVSVDCEQHRHHGLHKFLISLLETILGELDARLAMEQGRFLRRNHALRQEIARERDWLGFLARAPSGAHGVEETHTHELDRHVSFSLKGAAWKRIASFAWLRGRREQRQAVQRIEGEQSVLAHLRERIGRYRALLAESSRRCGHGHVFLFLDDFYQLPPDHHLAVIDFLHVLSRNSVLKYKVATVRSDTRLYSRGPGGVRGAQSEIDYRTVDLDLTFERFPDTRAYLMKILSNVLHEALGRPVRPEAFANEKVLDRLVIASGGVPRDFLNIMARSLELATQRSEPLQIQKEDVFLSAQVYLDETKRDDLHDEPEATHLAPVEQTWKYLYEHVVSRGRLNVFLVNRARLLAHHEAQRHFERLVDARFIHLVGRNVLTGKQPKLDIHDAYSIDLGAYSSFLSSKGLFSEIDITAHDLSSRKRRLRKGVLVDPSDIVPGLRRS